MELFAIEPGLAIWTWISFGVLFFILSKFALPVIIENINNREQYISSAVDKTAAVEKRLEEVEQEKQAIIQEANTKADRILFQARQDAEVIKQDLIKKAEKEASNIVHQGRLRAQQEHANAMTSLQEELAQIVCQTSEQLIRKSFLTEKERKWTRDLVQKL